MFYITLQSLSNLSLTQDDIRSTQIPTRVNLYKYKENQIFQFRGGGCGPSRANPKAAIKNTQKKLIFKPSPNIGINIEKKVNSIVEKVNYLTSDQNMNDIVLDIQWFINKRKMLIGCCLIDQQVSSSIIKQFESLLDILPRTLQTNWFICYQILQICNDLARILFTHNQQNVIKFDQQNRFLEKLKYLGKQLDNVSPKVWKTGLQFEITLLEIMFTQCITNSSEGKESALKFLQEAVKSVINFTISDEFIQSIFLGIKYLIKKSVNNFQYPFEVYKVYFLFQILKFEIIYSIKQEQQDRFKYIQKLKEIFEKFIMNSDNWILHFCWISLITDLILYRPSIKPQNDIRNDWNQLIQQQLVQKRSSNEIKNLLILFQRINLSNYNEKIQKLLKDKRQKDYNKLVSFLLQGQLSSNFDIWNHYRNFSFKNSITNSEKKDYEIILATDEAELLNKYMKQFQEKIDETSLFYEEILSFQQFNDQSQHKINQMIQQDHIQKVEEQFEQAWAEAIKLFQMIREFAHYEKIKIDLLNSCIKDSATQLNALYKKIQQSKNLLDNFEKQLVEQYFEQMEYLHRNQTQSSIFQGREKNKQATLIEDKNMEFHQFKSLCKDLIEYKQLFIRVIDKYSAGCIFQNDQFKDFFVQIWSRTWIGQIIQNYALLKDINNCDCQGKLIQILNYNLSNLRLLQKLFYFQEERQYQLQKKLNLFESERKSQPISQHMNYNSQVTNDLQKIIEKLIEIKGESMKNQEVFIKQKIKQFIYQIDEYKFSINSNNKNYGQISLVEKTIFLMTEIKQNYLSFRYSTKLKILNNNSSLNQEQITYQTQQEESIQKLYAQQTKDKNIEDIIEALKNKLTILQDEWKKIYEIDSSQSKQESDKLSQIDFQNYHKEQNALKYLKHFYKYCLKQLIINQNFDQSIQKINLFYRDNMNQIDCQKQIIFSIKEDKFESNISMVGCIQFLQFYQINLEQVYQEEKQNTQFLSSIWSDIKRFYSQIKNQTIDFFEEKDYKVKECLVFNLIKIQQSNLEDCLIDFSTKQLKQIWCYEKDQRVRNLLKNKELVEMQKLFFQRDLQSFSDQIKDEIQRKIQLIDQLQSQIRIQGNQKEREKLNLQLKQVYQDLDESLDNISEMSQIMDINLIFLKDIMKNVKEIKTSIENLQDCVNNLSDDIRKLRGKKYDQLLEIRMNKVFAQMDFQEIDSVYVQSITRERILPSKELKLESKLFLVDVPNPTKDFDGEVNEFIWKEANEKDVMLISGFAGSGKSRAAKKIEEFLWKLKHDGLSKWIPIYVSLPTLKNPKFNLFEQALESENYQFDKYQIKEFKKAIQDKQEKIILILDSYDEMKADCIQQNLIQTNKLIQNFTIDKNDRQVKFLITTRREILITDGYENWFKGESLKSYKEVQLLNFNEQQQEDYLSQYCELSVKRIIKSLYEFLKSVQNQNFDPLEFKSIWQQLQTHATFQLKFSQDNSQEFIFLDKLNQTSNIIQEIKSINILKNLSDEQIVALKKDLESLWNVNKFSKTISTAKLKDLLTSPFMLEIAVQILPSIIRNYQDSQLVRDCLKSNLKKIINAEEESYQQRIKFQENNGGVQNQLSKNMVNSLVKNNRKELRATFQNIDFIINQLESQKFFQKYSIDSEVKQKENQLLVNSNKFEIQSECIDIIIRALKLQNLTTFEFYDNFINFYHDQQIMKLRDLGLISNQQSFTQDVHQYSLSLALDMTIRDLSQIEYLEKGKLKLKSNYKVSKDTDDWLDQYLSSQSSDNEYKKLIKSSTLLSAKGSMYSFTHKSIQEFYVAYFIFNFLNSIDIKNKKEELLKSIFNQEQFNISTESFLAACKFIQEKLKKVENMQQKLLDIVFFAREKEYIRASSNSIYLLSLFQVYLGEKDFNSIQLMNTNISKLCFVNSNLSQSVFRNVQIDQCNFNYCNLSGIDWLDIKCQEQPSREIEEQFKQLQFTSDGQHILSVTKSGKIEIRNSKNYYKEQDILEEQFQLNEDNYLIFLRQKSGKLKSISEIKNKKLLKTDYQKSLKFSQSKDLNQFFIQTLESFRVQNIKQIEQKRDKFIKVSQKKKKIDDQVSLFLFSPQYSVLVYAKQKELYFSIVGEKSNKKLATYQSEIEHLKFSMNGQYFICVTQHLYIFKRIEKNNTLDFLESNLIFNINLDRHQFFLEDQNLYVVQNLKQIAMININENKVVFKNKKLIIENYENVQKQQIVQQKLENIHDLLNISYHTIHLILLPHNQPKSNSQLQFFILFSTKKQIYFNNPELKKLCIPGQEQNINSILILQNHSLNKIEFILATKDDKIIFYKISYKDQEFTQLFAKQLYIENFTLEKVYQQLDKNYTLSDDGKTLYLQSQNYLRWYSITVDQTKDQGISGLGIIPLKKLTKDKITKLYFSDLEYILMIVCQNKNQFFFQKIKFSQIPYLINIEIFKDSYISLSKDEQVVLISNKSKKFIIYFHLKDLNLQKLEYQHIYAAEAVDKTTFIKITKQNNLYKIQLCKLEMNSEMIVNKDKKNIGNQCLYQKYFQEQNKLVIQDFDKFIKIINMKNLNTIEKIKENEIVLNSSISPDTLVFIYELRNQLKFWNINKIQNMDLEILQGHQKEISAITFSKDNLLVASGATDGTIILWDYKNLQYLIQFSEHKKPIQELLFYIRNSNQILISCSEEDIIKIWSTQYPFQEKESLYTINSLYPINSISISLNQISISNEDYLIIYDYQLEQKIQPEANFSFQSQRDISKYSFLSDDYYLFYQNYESLNYISIKTQEEKNLDKNCKSMILSNDNQYLIIHKSTNQILIMKKYFEKKQISEFYSSKWKQISEFYFSKSIKIFKLSSDNKILLVQESQFFIFYDFQIIEKQIVESKNYLNKCYFYSISDDFKYAIIFEEYSQTIELRNIENQESGCKQFSYIKQSIKYHFFQPKLSKNQKYIAALADSDTESFGFIIFWEVNNPNQPYLKPIPVENVLTLYEFSSFNEQDYIIIVHLNEKEKLIKIYTYNLYQQKFENINRQIETQISKNYCFSNMHQYFCILNQYKNSQQINCFFEIYGLSNEQLDVKIQININEDYGSDVSIAFSQDETVFAIRISKCLFGYKKNNNNFIKFLKISVEQNSIIKILRNNTRIFILDQGKIRMLKINIDDIVEEDEKRLNQWRLIVLQRSHYSLTNYALFNIHKSEEKIIFCFNDSKEQNILILDLFENVLFIEQFQDKNEFCFSQNCEYYAQLIVDTKTNILRIFSIYSQHQIFQKEIKGDSIQFLDNNTKNIFIMKEGIITREKQNLVLYNLIEDTQQLNFEFHITINKFQIKGETCLISSYDFCQIFKITKEQKFIPLQKIPDYKGYLINETYIQFQSSTDFPRIEKNKKKSNQLNYSKENNQNNQFNNDQGQIKQSDSWKNIDIQPNSSNDVQSNSSNEDFDESDSVIQQFNSKSSEEQKYQTKSPDQKSGHNQSSNPKKDHNKNNQSEKIENLEQDDQIINNEQSNEKGKLNRNYDFQEESNNVISKNKKILYLFDRQIDSDYREFVSVERIQLPNGLENHKKKKDIINIFGNLFDVQTVIIHQNRIPGVIDEFFNNIRFHRILSEENKIVLIDSNNTYHQYKIENHKKLDYSKFKIQGNVIQFDNEDFFVVENNSQIQIFKKNNNSKFQYQMFQCLEISDLKLSNLLFSQNANYFLKCRGNSMKIYNLKLEILGENQNLLEISEAKLFALSPDGCSFATGQSDGTVNLFKLYPENFDNNSQAILNQKTIGSIICYKSLAIQQNVQSNGCVLNEHSKIISSSNNNLIQLFKARGAIVRQN